MAPALEIQPNKIYLVVGASSIAGRRVRVESIRPGGLNDLRVSVELLERQENDTADPMWVMRPSELSPVD